MKDFASKIAVVTGGGTGMGRELVRQLVAEGCSVAMCDVNVKNMDETKRLCEAAGLPPRTRVSTHLADVSDETAVLRFRDDAAAAHETDHIHLLFNNAGIGAGGSFLTDPREDWERTFNVCWYGVYYCSRAFMPLLLKASEAHLVNTSSVNGFWASLGPQRPHTAYSAAKFAVKGFTEALITDLRMHAPHVKCSIVMPGYIGTDIVLNTFNTLRNRDSDRLSTDEIPKARARLKLRGIDEAQLSDDQVSAIVPTVNADFRDRAPMTAAEAATVILKGVREERWRILVGRDAEALDRHIRAAPEQAYEADFLAGIPEMRERRSQG